MYQTDQPYKMTKLCIVALAAFTLSACGSHTSTGVNSTSALSGKAPSAASYTPRIGIGVSTTARTCIAIRNGNLTNGTVITLITPLPPVLATQATVTGVAQQPCPISQNVDTTMSNYNVTPQVPVQKQTPLIAVVGTPALTVNAENVGQADLDQNGQTETFRACSSDNGFHLSVWHGAPLQGEMLWHGFFYQPGATGIGAPCTPSEVPAS